MAIRILDAATISKIAAGEVVERPASVIKELVENSLDAGARHITVDIRGGGIDYIRVTDDGCGIPADQVRMAFENHATSKLREVKDLVTVETMGFRGEALPSIAVVSHMEMNTRTADSDMGTHVELEAGVITDLSPMGCPVGTTVQVKGLFFNLPVRKAFLKKPASEAAACTDTVTRLALGHPDIAFRLMSNGKQVFRTQGDGIARHAVMTVYDRVTAENMYELNESMGTFSISGLIGVGSAAKASRSHEHFFVNGRAIRCAVLSQALEQACKGRVMIGRFPMCVLNIGLPANSVDVNVHPGKLEVRFRDEAEIFTKAATLIERAFAAENMLTPEQPAAPKHEATVFVSQPIINSASDVSAPPVQPRGETPEAMSPGTPPLSESTGSFGADFPKQPQIPSTFAVPARGRSETGAPPIVRISTVPDQRPDQRLNEAAVSIAGFERERKEEPIKQLSLIDVSPDFDMRPEDDYDSMKLIGIAFDTYIFVEYDKALYVIDQHAAHERILYEKFMREWENGVNSQILLIPYTVTVSAQEKAQIMENKALLYEIGFDIDDFGQTDIQVRAVPQIMGEPDMRPFFLMTAAELKRLKNAPLSARRDAVMQQACKHAVKGGDVLSRDEIISLLRQMRETDAPANCPHGRPVIVAIQESELEKRFNRIV